MNDLTVEAHANAAAVVAESGDTGYCDAGDVDADRFGDRVQSRLTAAVSIDAAHGADSSNELVGAASIIAKSERERHIAALSDRFGDVGSGYPSDESTRAFLRQYFEEHGAFPPPTRRSWSTCASIRAESQQADIGEF